MLSLMGFAMASMTFPLSDESIDNSYPLSPEEMKEQEQKNLEKYYLSKGLKKYTIEGKEVWARNGKNALKKAMKR